VEAMCEPMKPAPPVTKAIPVNGIRLRLSAHADVLEPQFAQVFRFVDVS
jgi:hypothetical protein